MSANDHDPEQYKGAFKMPDARQEKKAETDRFKEIQFLTWEKANKLEYDEFVGWMKGEDLKVIKTKTP